MGLDRVRRDAQSLRNLRDRQLLVVAQDKACPLTLGKRAQGIQHLIHFLVVDGTLVGLDRRCRKIGTSSMPERHQPSTVVITCKVDHDRPQKGRSPVKVPNGTGRSVESDECLLHEVFGSIAIVTEHPRQSHERPTLFGEHLRNERVGIDGLS